jgi:PAS domain-containing protein
MAHAKYRGLCRPCAWHKAKLTHDLGWQKELYNHVKCREQLVADFVVQSFGHVTWRLDRTTTWETQDCSLRRPDLVAELDTHHVIVECDEHQHARYNPDCEQKRVLELYAALGALPLVVLRFNPDSYHTLCGKLVPSILGLTARGETDIARGQEADWTYRRAVLRARLEYWLTRVPSDGIVCELLFYDGWDRDTDEELWVCAQAEADTTRGQEEGDLDGACSILDLCESSDDKDDLFCPPFLLFSLGSLFLFSCTLLFVFLYMQ